MHRMCEVCGADDELVVIQVTQTPDNREAKAERGMLLYICRPSAENNCLKFMVSKNAPRGYRFAEVKDRHAMAGGSWAVDGWTMPGIGDPSKF